MDDMVKPWCFYVEREVVLWYFAEDEPFGVYDRETKTLTITRPYAMGHLTREEVERYLLREPLGSMVLYGVPRKAYELREKARYTPQRDL